MRIAMFTNTYLPHVGGVANSVDRFAREYRRQGHRVHIVAPEFDDWPESDPAPDVDVTRVPAIQHFNGSDFSVALPLFGHVEDAIDAFAPDVVHAHHPFLLGNTAVRVARDRQLPLVFTHHTLYEQYTHYVPADSPELKRFVVMLATCYANLCDLVIAPSESVAAILRGRGVTTPIATVATGVDPAAYVGEAGSRAGLGLPGDAFVIGHVGRLAPEKNLDFLGRAVSAFVGSRADAHFLLVGKGPAEEGIAHRFRPWPGRLHRAGVLHYPALAGAYRAMDVFAFASQSETQGMVLVEAMAAGVPVVALDAPGVREVVRDGRNGRLIAEETVDAFCRGLDWAARLPPARRSRVAAACLETAEAFSIGRCAARCLALYESLAGRLYERRHRQEEMWWEIVQAIETEWLLASGMARAIRAAVGIGGESGDAAS